MPPGPDVEEIKIPTPFGSIEAKSLHLNTLATVATLIGITILGMGMWFMHGMLEQHRADAKEASQQVVSVMKEQTVAVKENATAQRVQNCLLQFELKDRQGRLPECERNAR